MPSLSIHLFGYPQIQVDDAPVKVKRRKTLALISYLALNAPPLQRDSLTAGCSREALAALFWPDSSQNQASTYLRQALWDFASAAGEGWLDKDIHTIAWSTRASMRVDVRDFDDLFIRWKSLDDPGSEAILLLEAAANLYRDDFMAGFSLRDSQSFDDWQMLEAERLRLKLAQVLEGLARLYSSGSDYEAALPPAQRWLELDPLNEAAHRTLMNLYSARGQRSAAIRQYEACQRILEQELGTEPEAETVALYQRIRTLQFNTQPGDAKAELAPSPVWPAEEKPPGLEQERLFIPTGKVTFLFTDIEGSTLLWETQPDAMRSAFTRQEAIIRKTMADHGGYVYKMIGDAFQVAFSTASAALSAGLDAQRRLQAENWRVEGGLKVRMALHACVTEERGDDYVGPELNRVARILDVGYGGQALISQAVYELSHDRLPDGAVLHDLGEHYLKDLVYPEHIYQLVAPGLIKDFPHLKTDAPPPDLPHQTMPFVGRRAEMDQVEALLQDPICRLISLVGIGGSGKTSLAIRIAAQTRTFPGRIYFIELAAIHALDELIQAIAQAVGFSFQSPIRVSISIGEAQAQLLNYLAEKSALLVLDNFEQIMACADFVAELLAAAPRLKLLVTSRERLNLPGEWVVNVIGLPFPGKDASRPVSEYPAIQLFVNGMQRNGMTASSVDDFNAIARICRLLEGLPLGIEMAASLTKMFTPVEIAAEIERDLDILTASWRGMPERHRTLRAVFDYSWRLLPEQEQEIFYRLAVFQGGFTREAAFEVVGAALASLTSLADKSFIHRVDSGRFDIRSVLKQYAEEKLSENAAAQAEMRTRHAHYYSDWLCCQFENLKGGEQVSALAALRAETVNLRTAWQQLLEAGEIEPIEGFLPALLLFYVTNDQRLETRAVTRLLSATEDLLRRKVDTAGNLLHPDLLALVLAAIRQFSFDPRYREKLIPVMQESLQLVEAFPDSQSKAFVYMLTCYVPTLQFHELLELCQNTIGIYTRLGDDWGLALAQVILADLLVFNGKDLDLARRYYQSSLETFNRLGNIWGQALCYMGLNYVEGKAGNAQEAYRLGCHGVDLFTRLGNYERALKINHYLGDLAAGMGDLTAARRHYAANLAHVSRIGDDYMVEFYTDLLKELSPGDKTIRSSSA